MYRAAAAQGNALFLDSLSGFAGPVVLQSLIQEIDSKKKRKVSTKSTLIYVFLSWLLYFTVPGIIWFLYESFHLLLKLGIT